MIPSSATSTSEAYELLISLLTKCPQTIEILPGDGSVWMHTQNPDNVEEPSFAPFLFVEGNLGIPQKILYKVYLYAVGVFKSARSCVPTRPTVKNQRNRDLDPPLVRVLTASSSILVLANPTHQTALNSRKHLVQMHLIDPHAELRFIASLLSSQHCAKHAELWYHRRWLLSATCDTQFSDGTAGVDSHCHLRFASQAALQQELDLVSRACELYPRNYFAWTHRLMCMRNLLLDFLSGTGIVSFAPIFRNEIAGVKGWIDRHVSDYSAIHSILTLSQAALRSGDSSLVQMVIQEDLLAHALSLVQEYPAHEALWIYVRTALSISDLWQTHQTQQFIDHFVQPLAYLQQTKIGTMDDLVRASQCAKQFLDRRVCYKFTPGCD
ncbi:hypothetical protein J3R82DRAFT_1472 [Butyriboletus roseoflavus]|nr:hypothetical protein J3R82DRAFT_1472 [Butyriboletus roseoflavus]